MKKKAHTELNFCLKIFRNTIILCVLYFVSVWAANEVLTWIILKPLAIFGVGYLATELANRYGIKPTIPLNEKTKLKATLIL